MFKAGQTSVWPIALTNLSVGPHVRHRYGNLFFVALLPMLRSGSKLKTDINVFLEPLAREFALLENGISLPCAIGDHDPVEATSFTIRTVKAKLLFASADLRALPIFTSMASPPAYYSCHMCNTKGWHHAGTTTFGNNHQ